MAWRIPAGLLVVSCLSGCFASIAEEEQPVKTRKNRPAATSDRNDEPDRGFTMERSSITDKDLPSENHNPDESERKLLRVVWGKPKMQEERRDGFLEVSGRLFLTAAGKQDKPVDWVQPIRVLLGRTAAAKPDWSKHHDRRDAVWAEGVVGHEPPFGSRSTSDSAPGSSKRRPAGEFTVRISLTELQRPIGETKAFQVGLCLGVKEGQTLTWQNTTPVLPQSLDTLLIQGPKPLSKSLQLINACPSPIGWDYDPLALVRASNHLRSLGKEKAISALREFKQIARDPGYGGFERRDPANIDTSNQWCLAILIPLVFETGPGGKGRPLRENHVMIWEGIPFHKIRFGGTSGWPPDTAPLVEWAANYGRVIDKPLRPTDQPLEAADTLFKKLARPEDHDTNRFGPGLREHLRWQAWRMISPLVEPKRDQSHGIHDERLGSETEWAKLKVTAAKLKIRWNEQDQEYCVQRP